LFHWLAKMEFWMSLFFSQQQGLEPRMVEL
jgi:hypothetical protein